MRRLHRRPAEENGPEGVRSGHGMGRLALSLGRARRKITRRWATVFAILCAGIVIFCLLVWPFTRTHLQAIAVLREIANQPVPSGTRGGRRSNHNSGSGFHGAVDQGPTGGASAVVHSPQRTNAPALVIFHGVHHLGIDEPRLMGFAKAMASCGLRVLTPELPDIKDYRVSEDSVQTIGESVKWFAAQTGGPVGVMGLSFSGGLALVAAADPLYRSDFKFALAVGSQGSMTRVTQYYMTGRDIRPDGLGESLKPHEYGPLVLEYEYLEDFVSAAKLERFRAVLRAHLYEDKQDEARALSALNAVDTREVLELMDTSLPATRAKIAASIARHAYEFAALSPEGHLRTLTTPVYLLHGRADNIIPSAETLWMESELPPKYLRAVLVSPVLSHINLDDPQPALMDEWHVVHFFALVMREAESKSGG